jgi:hypothetical protein
MVDAGGKECPMCKGMKVIPGSCECNMEWRGNKGDNDEWEDCRCARELECPACHGTGLIEQ